MWRWLGVVGLVAACGAAGSCGGGAPPPEGAAGPVAPATPVETVEEWRARHEASYREQYVTIAGLFPLKAGANSAGSAPANDIVLPGSVPASIGRFVLDGDDVRFEPERGVEVTLDGAPVVAPVRLDPDTAEAPDELVVGTVRLVVHPSGDARMLRVRDPDGPLAAGFLGFTWFPIDPAMRVVGRFIPDDEPASVRVPNTFGDVDTYRTEGVVEFTLAGETLRLRPFTTRPNRFWFVFRDASSGVETYEAARFLYADLQPDGRVELDFNRAYNPPCAFNPYTTCPIPLAENRLPVKILAGERDYPVDVKLPDAGSGT